VFLAWKASDKMELRFWVLAEADTKKAGFEGETAKEIILRRFK